MNSTPNTEAFAAAVADLLTGMIDARRSFAEEHGFSASDDEIADHVAASFVRLARERGWS